MNQDKAAPSDEISDADLDQVSGGVTSTHQATVSNSGPKPPVIPYSPPMPNTPNNAVTQAGATFIGYQPKGE